MDLLKIASQVASPQGPQRLRVVAELPFSAGEDWLASASYEDVAKLVLDAARKGKVSLDAEIVRD